VDVLDGFNSSVFYCELAIRHPMNGEREALFRFLVYPIYLALDWSGGAFLYGFLL
jgi:hypothetical protein